MSADLDAAKALLESDGYTVLRTKSYNQMRERHYGRECELRSMQNHLEGTERWAHRAFDEQNRLADRCSFLYGKAMEHGATMDELKGES